MDGHEIRNINWPNNCLVICIRRGEADIVPHGDTKLIAGDYLYLSGEDEAQRIDKFFTMIELLAKAGVK
jgi:Trk K+ transport system NAD-binding subunit